MTAAELAIQIVRFRDAVWDHFGRCGRTMPWRETTDPYHIVVSEIMLQQTQVSRVAAGYRAFLQRFPTWHALAEAQPADVVRQWQGLGYNRRAQYLQRSAIEVITRFDGVLPADQALLATLPGIGVNTAGAICAFAFGQPVVFIETNIRRAFIDFFFAGRHSVRDSELLPLIEAAIDRSDPRTWYWALMDYGAALKGRSATENPNRRSSHYTRQSRFEGSRRQLRGAILRLLADGGGYSAAEIADAVAADGRDALESVLDDLEREGFLAAEQARYRLR